MILDWVYHAKNRKACYYEPACMICYLRTALNLVFRLHRKRCVVLVFDSREEWKGAWGQPRQ